MPAQADELIFQRRMEFGKQGVVWEDVVGSPVATLADGKQFVVGIRNLRADDGTVFGIDYDLGQASEDAAMDATVRVWRLDTAESDPDALVKQYAEVNPEASAADLALFRDGIAVAKGSGLVREMSVDADLRDWLDAGGEAEARHVVALLSDAPALDLPPPVDDLLDVDPVAALNRMESRLLAIEAHQTRVGELQKPVIADLDAVGAVITSAGWLTNTLNFDADQDAVRALLADPRFARLQFESEGTYDNNDGIATRASTQMTQFVQAGYLGGHPSGLNGRMDIFAVVVDDCIDEDHPAWNDSFFHSSRLGTVWRWDTSLAPPAYRALLASEDSATGTCHGNGVAGIIAADLTGGQDSGVSASDTGLRADRSGVALEGTFDFVERGEASFDDYMEKVSELNPDVLNLSFGDTGHCGQDHAYVSAVDALFTLDTLVVKSAGNEYHRLLDPCTVSAPAQAGAVLVAGALETVDVADLQAGDLDLKSSQGPDSHGRALIDLVAPGRQTSNLPMWNDAYRETAAFTKTSAAAPTLAGAVADLKDLLSTFLPGSVYNDVGNLYATMLLMGDGTLSNMSAASSPGATATHGDPLDKRWGAGRLRMRMFTDDGMDSPWRARWCVRSVSQGSTGSCLANPSEVGINQALSSDVERLRAAAYWFEPNLGSLEDPANIAFAAYKNGGFQYQTAGTAPSKKRLREDDANGALWDVRAIGWCVPEEDALFDPTNPYANCVGTSTRTVHIALYWEDMDRETLDAGIQ